MFLYGNWSFSNSLWRVGKWNCCRKDFSENWPNGGDLVNCWRQETDTRKSVKESKARLGYARSFSNQHQMCQVWTADPCHGIPMETNTGQVVCNLAVCVRTGASHGAVNKPNQTKRNSLWQQHGLWVRPPQGLHQRGGNPAAVEVLVHPQPEVSHIKLIYRV